MKYRITALSESCGRYNSVLPGEQRYREVELKFGHILQRYQ